MIQPSIWISCKHRFLNYNTFFSFFFLIVGHNLSVYPDFDVPATSPTKRSLKDREEKCIVNRKSPVRENLALSTMKAPRTDSDEAMTRCPKPDGAVTAPGHTDTCSESQVCLTIVEAQNQADLAEDAWRAGPGSDGMHSLASGDPPGRSPGPAGGQDPVQTDADVRSRGKTPCSADPAVAAGAWHESGHFGDTCEPDGAPLHEGVASGGRQNAISPEKTAAPESRTPGQGAGREGKAALLSLKLHPGEPDELPGSALADSWDVRASSPKDPRTEGREELALLPGLIKRSSSVISDSGIESEPSSVAWSEARSRALELPGDRDAVHQLVRRHALHRASLGGGRTESSTSLPSGAQASLTSISSLPFEEEGRELALTTLTKSASAPQISSPEESAEDAGAVRPVGGLAEAMAVQGEGADPPGPCLPLSGASGIQDVGGDCPPLDAVSGADSRQGPGDADPRTAEDSQSDPRGPCCLDGWTENPPGVETKGLNLKIPWIVAPGHPGDGPRLAAPVGTPRGTSAESGVGPGAVSDSGSSDVAGLAGLGRASAPNAAGPDGAGPRSVAGDAALGRGARSSPEVGRGAGSVRSAGAHAGPAQVSGSPEPRPGPSVAASQLAPAETCAPDGLRAVEMVNLSVSCTATCLPFSSVPTETPARAAFSSRQTPFPITHQPLGSFGVVPTQPGKAEEDAGARMFR